MPTAGIGMLPDSQDQFISMRKWNNGSLGLTDCLMMGRAGADFVVAVVALKNSTLARYASVICHEEAAVKSLLENYRTTLRAVRVSWAGERST